MTDVFEFDTLPEVPSVDFVNEKGNVRTSARNKLHKAMYEFLSGQFEDGYVVPNVNGGFSVAQGIDNTTGNIIWTHINIKVNMKSPTVDDYTGKPKQKAPAPIIPNLFDQEEPMEEKDLMRPVFMGDLLAATEALAEEIKNSYVSYENAGKMYTSQEDMKNAFEQTMQLLTEQSKYFSNVIGAITFVMAQEKLISEEELQMLSAPDFDTNKFIRNYVFRVTSGAIDLDAVDDSEVPTDEDDDTPIGRAQEAI